MELSIVIPARNEGSNLVHLLPHLHQVLKILSIEYEIIIVDETANIDTREVTNLYSARLLVPNCQGYGSALNAGIANANGKYIITMDADLSHSPDFLISLWNARHEADIVIASRYVRGGKARMPLYRFILSRIFNSLFSRGLDLKVKDMSSGYRLYKASIFRGRKIQCEGFDILQEIIVSALIDGYSVTEIPFTYQPREHGSSHGRIFTFGYKYIQTYGKLWRRRNSIESADYDDRAFHTLMLPQRYWQRKRFKIISKMFENDNICLDVGCGSSRILSALPRGSIGLDIEMRKLRYSRKYDQNLYLNGSANSLPIACESVKCVVCSEVIEHIHRGPVFNELDRVLSPGGLLILGTPDYDKWQWNLIERLYKLILPQAYADEHITHYSYKELIDEFVSVRKYQLMTSQYILRGELIISLRKPIS